ncbi:PH domain-containing protein [Enterococcus faecium]|uniref:PH domain-containing protein n=2 Tax=Enterococcus faecium TaxID=1352 RepID=A0A6A8NG77_ENTFC|nr:PH domain-containing protein [Enterococcus faecium]MBD9707657.1 PH domain-containing protein [Enterococcus faecium]MTD23370.1 PH domain-containing protein [Enterococcus faecium]MTD35076.1 PH domain-containing protein [Enterococcus faecium]
MGLFDGIMGNATQLSDKSVEKELKDVLTADERIDLSFKLVRDLIVFTNKRLIIIDKQGVSGKKVEYKSIPYKSISRFSIETSGHFDLDAELKIWISSAELPAETLQFRKDKNIIAIQQALASAVLH